MAPSPHRFPAHSLSLSRDYLSSKICNLDFVEEPGDDVFVFRELRLEHLDRYASTDRLMYGFEHASHAAVANLAGDFVMSNELTDHGALSGEANPHSPYPAS